MITSSTHPPPSRKHSTVQMGQSSSNRRRREEYYPQNPNPNPSPSSSSSNPLPPLPPTPPTPPPPPPPYPPNYSNPYPAPPPACSYYSQHHTSSYGPPVRYYNHFMGRSGYPGILPGGQGSGWWPSGSSSSSSSSPWMMPGPQQLPPPYVEHQKAKTIKNDVNLHKDTIRLEPDPQNPDHHLVSFTYDSLVDGSVTIFYFAKEGADCSFSPVYPDMYMPVAITFEKGVHQKFCQPSGSGVDLGFFEYDALSKPSSDDVFPLVIYAEACPPPPPGENGHSKAATRAQITLAVIERKADETFLVKVVKQILWVDGERYELQEIFGLGSSAETGVDGNGDEDDENMGKECVICLSEPRDTAVLPCRHMCMCSECAKALRLQSNKCPICRQPVEKLMEIKVKREVEQ